MAEEKVSARVAADRAMGQVGGALVAIVLVALRGVPPGGVPRRDHRHDVHAVRRHAGGRGGDLRHRGAHAHAGALRDAAQGHAARRVAATASSAGSTSGSTGHRAATCARSAACCAARALARRVRRDAGAHRVLVQPGADRVHPDRGQGLLRHGDPAARRRVAAADRRGRRAGRRDACARSRRRARGQLRWLELQPAGAPTRPTAPSMFVLLKPWDERDQKEHSSTRSWPGSTVSSSG